MTAQATTLTVKALAAQLDDIALRTAGAEGYPASAKQNWFLAKLLVERGKDLTSLFGANTRPTLTGKQASFYIDQLLAEPATTTVTPASDEQVAAARAAVPATDSQIRFATRLARTAERNGKLAAISEALGLTIDLTFIRSAMTKAQASQVIDALKAP